MAKQIFVNLPVSDLARSTAFYEKLGFSKNPFFSDEKAVSMMWSNEIVVMLVTHSFYKSFIKDRSIVDATKTSGVLLALTVDSTEAVQQFAETAKANGGDYYHVEAGVPEDMMFSLEVSDPDGHSWEPVWMNPNFDPQAA